MGKDNLTNGPMARHFRSLALPAAFGMLFATLYNIVDVYYAGLLSTDAQAGLAIGYQAIFILMALGFGLSSALSALVSNAKGSGDKQQTQRFIAQGLTFSVIITITSMVRGWILGPKLIELGSRIVWAVSRPEIVLKALTESCAEKSLRALPTPMLAEFPWGKTQA